MEGKHGFSARHHATPERKRKEPGRNASANMEMDDVALQP
jgi:hypothetical protein